jgi:carbonic anhydrase
MHAAAVCVAAFATAVSGNSAKPFTYDYSTVSKSACTVNPNGPYCWPTSFNTSPDTCGGLSQSPINIVHAAASNKLEALKFSTSAVCSTVSFANNEHTLEATTELCPLLNAEFNGTEYELQQLHLRSPSEHTIGGASFDGELQMVHKSKTTGKTMVVGVLLNSPSSGKGANHGNNAFIDRFLGLGINPTTGVANPETAEFNTTEETEISFAENFNPYTAVLPGNPAFYSYSGSLTMPPCTEAVDWVIFASPVSVSSSQMLKVRTSLAATHNGQGNYNPPLSPVQYRNNRPVQALKGRVVTLEIAEPESEKEAEHEEHETFWYSSMLKPVGEFFGFVGVLVMIVGGACSFANLARLGVRMIFGDSMCKSALLSNSPLSLSVVRVQFAKSVILSLEILVAADVIDTLAKPVEAQTFTQLGLISLIVVIRTVLSLHLGHELHQIKNAHGGRMNHHETEPLDSGSSNTFQQAHRVTPAAHCAM